MGGQAVAQEAGRFLASLPRDSRVRLLPFEGLLRPGIWGHPDDAELAQRLRELDFRGGTALWDALFAALTLMGERSVGMPEGAEPTRGAADRLSEDPLEARDRFLANGPRVPAPVGTCSVAAGRDVRRIVVAIAAGDDTASSSNVDERTALAWVTGVPVFSLGFTRTSRFDWRGGRMQRFANSNTPRSALPGSPGSRPFAPSWGVDPTVRRNQ